MTVLSRHVALISDHESDHMVLAQAFADHPDRLVLHCFTSMPDDAAIYGVILADTSIAVANETDVQVISLNTRPLRVGMIVDQVESALLSTNTDEALTYKNYVLDKRAMQFSVGDRVIALTEREVEILAMLMQAGEKGCRRESMLDRIWGYRADLETHTLETHIYRLRQKIEDQPNDPLFLVTCDNGYRLD